jgi:hypothetical protein
MKTLEIKAPNKLNQSIGNMKHKTVFLAGSIEMGTAENWQQKIVDAFPFDVTFFNPRRDDWDSSWKQELNNPQFYQQVTWELDMLDSADIIIMYFDPKTKSPISLLELGLHATERKELIVCCPEGFWRKGNVDIVCQRFGIPVFTSLDTMIIELKNRIN